MIMYLVGYSTPLYFFHPSLYDVDGEWAVRLLQLLA